MYKESRLNESSLSLLLGEESREIRGERAERREKRAERREESRERERRKRERRKDERKREGEEREAPVCRFKTPPCVPAKRAHVLNTCARFAGTHGGV